MTTIRAILSRLRNEPVLLGAAFTAFGDALTSGLSWQQAFMVAGGVIVRSFVTPTAKIPTPPTA
jgi:hypothetical protein